MFYILTTKKFNSLIEQIRQEVRTEVESTVDAFKKYIVDELDTANHNIYELEKSTRSIDDKLDEVENLTNDNESQIDDIESRLTDLEGMRTDISGEVEDAVIETMEEKFDTLQKYLELRLASLEKDLLNNEIGG